MICLGFVELVGGRLSWPCVVSLMYVQWAHGDQNGHTLCKNWWSILGNLEMPNMEDNKKGEYDIFENKLDSLK